ncbi:hypothetical protein [Pontibacter burrus]|uniref:Uncharacterized protein n=1 Tax=Pontibacter burrus TaxID=2704466 RepID=A0A6B3LL91_9BACT|nr:hypothetical protein [Pontibacter burrus]NEM96733.1 hypothetical protein [Pontibacter burrus]
MVGMAIARSFSVVVVAWARLRLPTVVCNYKTIGSTIGKVVISLSGGVGVG